MPYAKGDLISHDPVEGGLEISESQYLAGLDAKINGRETVVLDDTFVIRDISPGPDYVWQDGDWVHSPPVVEPIEPTADMVRAEGARRLALIGEPYSKEERETWPQQVEEAKAVSADVNAEAPLLARLAAPRGITVAQMAAAVIAKANAFASAAGDILAAQSALLAMDPIPADFAADARWIAE